MQQQAWFKDWFNSPYYHLLYSNRNENEASDFIKTLVTHLHPPSNAKMLDVACGKGRHSKALADMQFDVTGIDLSENSITEAKLFENEHLSFFQHDMRMPFWVNYFHYTFNFFTSFGYFRTRREHDNAIRMMAQSLLPEGLLVIDYLNVVVANRTAKQTHQEQFGDVTFHITKWSNEHHLFKQIQVTDQHNNTPKHLYTERVAKFTLGDFTSMLADQHLHIQEVYGNYQLQRFSEQESPRLIIIAKK